MKWSASHGIQYATQVVENLKRENNQLDIAGVAADGERGEVLAGESADEFHPPRVTPLDARSRLYFT